MDISKRTGDARLALPLDNVIVTWAHNFSLSMPLVATSLTVSHACCIFLNL